MPLAKTFFITVGSKSKSKNYCKKTVKRTYRVERLARREEKLIIKRIFTLSVLSIVIIAVLLTLGIPALGKFADLLDKVFKRGSVNPQQQVSSLLPPRFYQLAKDTGEQKINIAGFASSGNKVELYLNNNKVDEVEIADGRFEFKDIKLDSGENKIKARTIDGSGKTSDFSTEEIINLDTTEPSLEVTAPVDGQTFERNNRIKVEGKTEKDAQVYANGFLANVDSDGNFEVIVPLAEGDNTIEVKALDEAGNSKIVGVKVNFRK